MQTSPIVLTTVAGLSTGLGGVLAVLGKPTEKLLAASAGFAGGVMLTASLTDLLPEALHFYSGYLPPLACGGALAVLTALGMAAAGLLGKLLPEESELAVRFGQGRDPARAAAMRTALITGAALLLHNFPEGVLTFFAGTADPALGLRTAAAIALHNIPEGLAVAVPFAYAARSRAAGVLAALVSGLAEPLGAVLAWLFLRRFFTPGFLNGTVVLAAGIMVWVSFAQLLPDAFAPKHRAAQYPGGAGCGGALRLRNPQPCGRCAGGSRFGAGRAVGGCAGVAVPAPLFYTRLFERHSRAGGRHYGVGVLCPAFARCVRP